MNRADAQKLQGWMERCKENCKCVLEAFQRHKASKHVDAAVLHHVLSNVTTRPERKRRTSRPGSQSSQSGIMSTVSLRAPIVPCKLK